MVGTLCVLGSGQTTGGPRRPFTNSIGMKFVPIGPGTFRMGSDSGDASEKPAHKITLTKGFYMQVTEVTQAQWQAVMGNSPSRMKGPDLPVEQVSWEDAQEFLKQLNAKEKGARYRLPREAEWEYAARAGLVWEAANLDPVAWSLVNSDYQTHPVGQKQPNGWGLYDMLGNVWEWCADRYGSEYYGKSPPVDPPGPAEGDLRVLRGGAWSLGSWEMGVAVRGRRLPGLKGDGVGFRCVRELGP